MAEHAELAEYDIVDSQEPAVAEPVVDEVAGPGEEEIDNDNTAANQTDMEAEVEGGHEDDEDAQPAQPETKLDDIFGDDDEEEGREGEQVEKQGAEEVAAGDDDEDAGADDIAADEDVDENEDAYVAGTATSAAKIPKFKKRRETSGDDDVVDDDEDDEDEERRRKKKKRKANKRAREARSDDEDEEGGAEGGGRGGEVDEEEEMGEEVDEATRKHQALMARIDNIGKKARVVRRKKKGGEDVDIVDTYHDEICARLRERMIAAADKDEAARRDGKPATTKLAMLDEVVSVLRNTTLFTSIVDNGVLDAVRRWLEPLPDRSLPAVGIQNAIFEILPKMDFDTTTLKECHLGHIVLFYTKTKRVTPTITRAADALVQTWSRPIIKRPADFRSKYVQRDEERSEGEELDVDIDAEGEGEGEDAERVVAKRMKAAAAGTKVKRFDVRAALAENVDRKGARLPTFKDVQYTVAPASRTQHRTDDLEHVSRIQLDNRKFNRFARSLKIGRK